MAGALAVLVGAAAVLPAAAAVAVALLGELAAVVADAAIGAACVPAAGLSLALPHEHAIRGTMLRRAWNVVRCVGFMMDLMGGAEALQVLAREVRRKLERRLSQTGAEPDRAPARTPLAHGIPERITTLTGLLSHHYLSRTIAGVLAWHATHARAGTSLHFRSLTTKYKPPLAGARPPCSRVRLSSFGPFPTSSSLL
jgi:hypothetical protein